MLNDFIIITVVMALIMSPLVIAARRKKTDKKCKNLVLSNLVAFGVLCLISVVVPIGGYVMAAPEAAEAVAHSTGDGIAFLGAALATGMATIGAGIAVASAASSAIGAISENSKNFGKAIVFVAMAEGVGIYGLIISIVMLSRL